MPRVEKKFGDITQATTTSFSQLVAASTTSTRNLFINIAGRSASSVVGAVFTAAPILAATSATLAMTISSSIASDDATGSRNGIIFNNPFSGAPTHAYGTVAASTGSVITWTVNGTIFTPAQSYTNQGYTNVFRFGQHGPGQQNAGQNSWNGNYSSIPFSVQSKFIDETTAIYSYQLQTQATTAAAASHTYLVATFDTASSNVTINYSNTGNQLVTDNKYYGTQVWEHAGVNNAKAYSLFCSASNISTAGAGGDAIGLRIVTKSNTTLSEGSVIFTTTTASTRAGVRFLSFFAAADYNQTYPAYAFSHPTATTANNTWYGISSTYSSASVGSVTLPSGPSNAGFRIVATDGTSSIRKFLDGTITYPAAPTGVTVPTDHTTNQVVSLKFSPNGKYLAVAYLRPAGSIGTSTANSVVVVYTRQTDGSYVHSASSGTSITIIPHCSDCMQWTPDNSSLIVASQTTVSSTTPQFATTYWHTGLTGDATVGNSNVPTFTIGWSKYPLTNSVIDPTTNSSRVYSGATATILTSTTTANPVQLSGITCFADSAGLPLTYVTGGNTGGNSSSNNTYRIVAAITGTVGSGNYPAYVNTVIPGVGVGKGTVTQISNIILSPGESLYVEAKDENSIDVAAYGVEIS